MSKPTPGPWEIETFPDGSFEIYTKPNEFVICERAKSAFPEETKANARLIAAAPELYEKLKALIKHATKTGRSSKTIQEAQALIRKIEG